MEDITDQRLNPSLCGVSRDGVEGLPTSVLESNFKTWQASEQAEFQKWMDSIRGILGEDTAGNLLNRINTKQNQSKAGNNALVKMNGSDLISATANVDYLDKTRDDFAGGVTIPRGADLNNYKTVGVYIQNNWANDVINSIKNNPQNSVFKLVVKERTGNNQHIEQIVYGGNDRSIMRRVYDKGNSSNPPVWRAWYADIRGMQGDMTQGSMSKFEVYTGGSYRIKNAVAGTDYSKPHEGTWSPVLWFQGTTSHPLAAYSSAGRFKKIDNMVYCSFRLTGAVSTSGWADNAVLTIGNLPYVCKQYGGGGTLVSQYGAGFNRNAESFPKIQVSLNNNYCFFRFGFDDNALRFVNLVRGQPITMEGNFTYFMG